MNVIETFYSLVWKVQLLQSFPVFKIGDATLLQMLSFGWSTWNTKPIQAHL